MKKFKFCFYAFFMEKRGFQVNNDIVYFLLALTHEQESIMPQMQVRGSCQEWKNQ